MPPHRLLFLLAQQQNDVWVGLKKTGNDCGDTAACANELKWEAGEMFLGESFWDSDQTSGSTSGNDCFRFTFDTNLLADDSCGAAHPYICQYICVVCPEPPSPTSDMTSDYDNSVQEPGNTVT